LPTAAFAQSGQITFVTGSVFIERAGLPRLPATRGMQVNQGDLIIAGADGMAQLSMIDQAKLSLRSNTQLRIERYQQKAGDTDGAVLNLVRGTLRTFTGLLTAANRDKFQMKTKVATVGIRGSGNILQHEDEGGKDVTINHTIEGSHVVTSLGGKFAPFITFPNDTVRVENGKAPEKIPTPPQILGVANVMVGKAGPNDAPPPEGDPTGGSTPPTGTGGGTGTAGNGVGGGTIIGTNIISTESSAPADPTTLRDVVVTGAGATYSGQAVRSNFTLEANSNGLRGFTSVPAAGGTSASIVGGTLADAQTIDLGGGSSISLGRWVSPTSATGAGFGSLAGGSTHFIYGNSGYPAYLSDVLTGTVAYTQAGATTPTNQLGATGSITSTLLSVNFTQRLLNATIALALGGNNYTLQAANVPFAYNSFFALTGFGLTVTNNTNGQNSNTNPNIYGQLEGNFVGGSLNGAILGYGFVDGSVTTAQSINGVVAFRGPAQNTNAPYRIGLMSDPNNSLAGSPYSQTYATINRPDEVTIDTTGRATAFVGPYALPDGTINGRTNYAIGSATAQDVGVDATTGLSWGRWSGGSATVGGNATSLQSRSLHYIFAAPQSAPTQLPLTGTAVYDVAGSTRPTDLQGNVGTMNSATLNANFTNRTVDTSVNVTIAGQTWNASANGVPIYRDLTFSANTGRNPVGGLPTPVLLNITCTPNCGSNFTGSIDGFFTGTTGQGAGMMYNLNRSISGAVGFRRRGG
jgi:FecR protein